MSDYSIGLSGLSAAQKALDVIGNNIANAATEGYHRQRIDLTPAYSSQEGSILFGGGVDIAGINRMIDSLLEEEIYRQGSLLEQISTELSTLRRVENAFGELSTENGGLNAAIDNFFNSLRELSAHPGEIVWQNNAVSAAETMAGQFRTLGEFLTSLETRLRLEAENIVERINTLTSQIAELNDDIEQIEIGGGKANNLRDQRDQYIKEISELIGIQIQSRDYGVVDVSVGGISIVIGASSLGLEVGLNDSSLLGISAAGAYNYDSTVEGGQLGGLLSLKNEIVSDINDDLDSLAAAIVQQINQYHVQGVGSQGSFTNLTGWRMTSESLADFEPAVSDGSIYIRVTNTSTEVVTRSKIDIDASSDTLSTIATAISAVTGLTASVVSSKLSIQADTNYKFDFLPAVLSSPKGSTLNLNGSSPPTVSVSGIYTGTTNQTFTFTVSGTGSVGNGSLQITVKDGSNNTVTTVDVGSGYAAGDELDAGNGLKIALTTGDLVNGDSFQVDAFGNTDTSGVLTAVGINTFFSGSSAVDIAVCSEISATPARIATALGSEMTDNTNISRLAELKDEAVSSLSLLSPGEFYRRLVTDIGQTYSVKKMREDNLEVMVQNLANQRSEISGVDINEEAAQLLIFEQMFQAMAKYISTIQSSIDSIMNLL